MTSKIFRLFLSLILFCSFSYSSETEELKSRDSLVSVWNDDTKPDSIRFKAFNTFYVDFMYRTPDSALKIALNHYMLAEQKNSLGEMAKALNQQAIAQLLLGSTQSSLKLLDQALKLYQKMGSKKGVATMYCNMGNLYREKSMFQEALKHYQKSLPLFDEVGMEKAEADVLNNIGVLYFDVKMYESSLQYLQDALSAYQDLQLEAETGAIWLNLGDVYASLEQERIALEYFNKAIGKLESENDNVTLIDAYYSLALMHHKLGEDDLALKNVNKSIEYCQKIGSGRKLWRNQILLGNLLMENDIDTAKALANSAIESIYSDPDNTLLSDGYLLLYQCFKRLEDNQNSLEAYEKHVAFKDSARMDENQITIIREAIENEFDQRLFEAQLENEKQKASLEIRQLKWIFAISLLAVILLVSGFMYARNRISKQRKLQASLLEEIETLKSSGTSASFHSNSFQLDRAKLEQACGKKLNETDWTVLNILVKNPVISNKELAQEAFLTVDGIGSSLKRMYSSFEIKDSKYKKISLLLEAIKISNA